MWISIIYLVIASVPNIVHKERETINYLYLLIYTYNLAFPLQKLPHLSVVLLFIESIRYFSAQQQKTARINSAVDGHVPRFSYL